MAEMRSRKPDEAQLVFMVFDLLHQDGVDLSQLPLTDRKRDLRRLCRKSRIPLMREIDTFPDGQVLLAHCNYFGFEGVVSKRATARYVSGESGSWLKIKCPDWVTENQYRHLMFEGPKKRAADERELALKKKREELACVQQQMRLLGISQAVMHDLSKREAILERKIEELEERI
jgi:hypothetical protein